MPAEEPEGDGTLRWIATTVCVVHAHAAGTTGMGWTYGPAPIAGMVAGLPASAHSGPARPGLRRRAQPAPRRDRLVKGEAE